MTRLIYLATPYSHRQKAIMLKRFHAVNAAAAKLMQRGHLIFSPISHSHNIAMGGGLPTDWNFWEAYDRTILTVCKELWVLMQDGWKESTGVQAEIAIATELGLPVRYLNPVDLLIYE